jgi:hypothetical protein
MIIKDTTLGKNHVSHIFNNFIHHRGEEEHRAKHDLPSAPTQGRKK